jgi:hypothetical protein
VPEEPEPAPPPPSAYPHLPPLSFEREGHQQQKLSLSTTASSSGAASLLSPSPTISSSAISPSTTYASRAWPLPGQFSTSGSSSSRSMRTSTVSEDPYTISSSAFSSQVFHHPYSSEMAVTSYANSQNGSFDNSNYSYNYSYAPSAYPANNYNHRYNQTTTTITTGTNKSTTSINGAGGDSQADTIEDRKANHRNYRDHSRIRASWEAMLASRFLPPQLLPVLPFYLSSTFEVVHSYPLLQVDLPSNSVKPPATQDSGTENGRSHCPIMSASSSSSSSSALHNAPELENRTRKGCAAGFDLAYVYRLSTSGNSTNHSTSGGASDSLKTSKVATVMSVAQQALTRRAPMHLAKTVRTIIACKEAIWDEYCRLFINNGPPVRTPGEKNKIHSVRDEFEREWWNWEK